jgi:hypothetical protein
MIQGHRSDVDSVDVNSPPARLVVHHAEEVGHQTRLAGTGASENTDLSAETIGCFDSWS